MERPSRRQFLAGVAGATVAGLAGCTVEYNGAPGPTLGSGSAVTGGVGSGFAYDQPAITEQDATHIVRSAEEIRPALETGTPERPAVLWFPGDASIDLTGYSFSSDVLNNAVLASTRSKNHQGAILYSNTQGAGSPAYRGGNGHGVFESGNNVRFTGFRYRGPTAGVFDHPMFSGYIPFPDGSESERMAFYDTQHARGISCHGDPIQIDNMEIFGWPTQGISVGTSDSAHNPLISNSAIHNCALTSAGYGLEVQRGHPKIVKVFFNGTRHAVAGFGHPDCGYTIDRCTFGPANSLFQVDMHYLGENDSGVSDPSSPDWRYRSGGQMRILNSTFTSTHIFEQANVSGGNKTPAIVIGGIPAKGVEVRGNIFAHGSMREAISQPRTPGPVSENGNGYVRIDVADNTYGKRFNYDIGQG